MCSDHSGPSRPSDVSSWSRILDDDSLREVYVREVKRIDKSVGAFLSFDVRGTESQGVTVAPDAVLKSLPLAVKDNIAVKDRPLTCGSRILENLKAPYTATAVHRLQDGGAVVVGKTNLDEFGMGSSNEHSALGNTVNPWDHDRVPGGSSGGSAAAVAAGLVPLALGSDTGGSVRQPANFCGIYGLKPTYGAVSRYGLTAYASSLDVIGAMATDLDCLEAAWRIMSAPDERDQSSLPADPPESDASRRRILMVDMDEGILDPAVESACSQAAEALRAAGWTVQSVRLPSMDLVVPCYYTIATAEASSNLARYNGVRYGRVPDFADNPAQLMRLARHEGFGDEVKLRILLGTYVLRSGFQDQYYGRAQKIRTLIRRELAACFEDGDIILLPVFPTQAFARGDSGMEDYKQRVADVFTCLANLAGVPALALPTGIEGNLPAGVQLLAPAFCEQRLFAAARDLAGHFTPLLAPGALNLQELV